MSRPAYQMIGRKERLADMLWELECALRTKHNVNTPRPIQLSVEHIMPQAWSTNWAIPDGRRVVSEYITDGDEALVSALTRRSALLHTIGNLTLATVSANIGASNGPFSVKSAWLEKSLLALNVEITALGSWDEIAIEARSKDLANIAVSVWPSNTQVI